MGSIKDALAVLRNPKLVTALLLACILLLILPAGIIPGWTQFRSQYAPWLVAAAAVFVAMLFTELGALILGGLRARQERQGRERHVVVRLNHLDRAEQVLLREFFFQGRNTIKVPIELPVVLGLVQGGVLVVVRRSLQHCGAGPVGIVTLSDVARHNLSEEMLGWSGNCEDHEDGELRQERPSYIQEILQHQQVWES